MVTGAMSKAGGSVGGFKLFPEICQWIIGPNSGPSIRSNPSRFRRCEQTKWARGRRPRTGPIRLLHCSGRGELQAGLHVVDELDVLAAIGFVGLGVDGERREGGFRIAGAHV